MADPQKNDAPQLSAATTNVKAVPLARMYAQAIHEVASGKDEAADVAEEFQSLVEDVFAKHPQFEQLLASRRISTADKEQVLDSVLGKQASETTLRSLKIIGRHGRLDLVRMIAEQLTLLHETTAGIVRVEVTSPVELNEQELEKLRKRLRESLAAEPHFITHTRADMLGGLRIRIADTVYDGSVATQLARLRQEMIQRSVHEIQSRRDRFGDPEGN